MSFKVKSTTLVVNDPEQVSSFLYGALGFSDDDYSQLMIIKDSEKRSRQEQQPIVITTDDCLQDYYELMNIGILPYTKPQYTELGLEFGLRDSFGNSYTVLEERDYMEA